MERVLKREGCPLRFWVGGCEGRPLVVLTHGACVDHHSFDPHVPAVAERYRVLNWDVRGHGLSRPLGEPFGLPLAVEDLLAILDDLGYKRAVFVGHSYGTYIAQELAFRHPSGYRRWSSQMGPVLPGRGLRSSFGWCAPQGQQWRCCLMRR